MVSNCSSSAESTMSLPVGFRFNPSDQQLLGYYLCNKLTGATAAAQPFDVPQVDDFSETKPWEMWKKLRVPKLLSTDLYFFTKLKMASRSRVDRKVGLGTWSEGEASKLIYEHDDDDDDDDEEEEEEEKVVIGRKRKLRYEEKGSEHHGGWFIDEYSLVDAAGRSCYDQLVICRLRKNDRSSSTITTGSKKRKSSSSSCATKKKKLRVTNDDDHPQQLGQDCTSTLTTTTTTYHDHHDHLPQLGQGQEQSCHAQPSAPLVYLDDDDNEDDRFMVDIGDLLSLDDLDYNSELMSSDPVVDVDQALQSLPNFDNNQMVVFEDQPLTSTTTYSIAAAGGFSNQLPPLDDLDCFDYNSLLMSSDPVVDIDQALQSLPNYDNNQTVVFEDQPLTSTTDAAVGMGDGQVVAGGYSNQYQPLDDMIINSSSYDCWSNSCVNELFMH